MHRLTVAKAATILEMNPQTLRVMLQTGDRAFGCAFKGSGSHYCYHIEAHQLRMYVGEEKWQEGLERWTNLQQGDEVN